MADLAPHRSFLVVLVALLVGAGCSDGEETSETTAVVTSVARSLPPGEDRLLPDGDEPEVLGPLGDTEAEFETEDGVVQIGVAEVPAAVPVAFPLPEGFDVQLASQDGDDAGFSGVSDLTFDELVAFYDTELPAAGYDAEQTRLVDDVVAVFDFVGPNGSGSVAISSAPGGGRSVLVTFTS